MQLETLQQMVVKTHFCYSENSMILENVHKSIEAQINIQIDGNFDLLNVQINNLKGGN